MRLRAFIWRTAVSSAFALIAFGATGCVSVSSHQQDILDQVKAAGLKEDKIQVKSPALAATLNILPGFGNVYLAAGTDETPQWLFGALNLFFWPFSVVTAIPEGAIDAGTMNRKATADYYELDPQGIGELAGAKEGLESAPSPPASNDP
jgi:hypothetical protein